MTNNQVDELFGKAYNRTVAMLISITDFKKTILFSCNRHIFKDIDFIPSNNTEESLNRNDSNGASYGVHLKISSFSPGVSDQDLYSINGLNSATTEQHTEFFCHLTTYHLCLHDLLPIRHQYQEYAIKNHRNFS